jgi:hypothetical protein
MRKDYCPIHDDPLPPDEFERRVSAAIAELDGEEGENLGGLVRWFLRRYPTPLDRLRYARRAHASAMRLREAGANRRAPG